MRTLLTLTVLCLAVPAVQAQDFNWKFDTEKRLDKNEKTTAELVKAVEKLTAAVEYQGKEIAKLKNPTVGSTTSTPLVSTSAPTAQMQTVCVDEVCSVVPVVPTSVGFGLSSSQPLYYTPSSPYFSSGFPQYGYGNNSCGSAGCGIANYGYGSPMMMNNFGGNCSSGNCGPSYSGFRGRR